jgi:hypothetical protein
MDVSMYVHLNQGIIDMWLAIDFYDLCLAHMSEINMAS